MLTISAIVGLLGAAMGSFVNVCIYRIPRNLSIVHLASFCPHCDRTLSWYELIPVVSYVMALGRCTSCGRKIPLRYPITEIWVGALTIVFFLIQGWSTAFLWTISFVFVMTTITVIDWQHLIIPNKVILAGLLAGSLLILVFYPKQLFPRVTSMVSAAGITALILMVGQLLFKKPVMGMGDVKLAGLVGLFLGLPGFLVAFWLAAIVGALFGLTKHHCQRTPIDAKLPFGSFLASTACLVLVGQDTIINWLMGWLIFLQ